MTEPVDVDLGDFEIPDDFDPGKVLGESLAAKAAGEPYDEAAATAAATILAAGALVEAGGDIDAVMRQFEERDHTLRINWDPDEGQLSVEVEWLDGDIEIEVTDG